MSMEYICLSVCFWPLARLKINMHLSTVRATIWNKRWPNACVYIERFHNKIKERKQTFKGLEIYVWERAWEKEMAVEPVKQRR